MHPSAASIAHAQTHHALRHRTVVALPQAFDRKFEMDKADYMYAAVVVLVNANQRQIPSSTVKKFAP